MTVGRQRALVVEVVEVTEPVGERVGVWRDLLTELSVGRIAVRRLAIDTGDVAQLLVIGTVLPDDHDHVLDRRAPAEMGRDDVRRGVVVALVDRLDLVPVVVGEDRLGVLPELTVMRHRERRHAAGVVVRVVVGGRGRVITLVDRRLGALGADALVVGHDDRVRAERRVRLDLNRIPVRRDQAGGPHRAVQALVAIHSDRVVAPDADEHVGRVGHVDRVRVAPHLRARHRVGPDGLGDPVRLLVDHRQAVVVRVGDEQGVAVLVERGRLEPNRDLLHLLSGLQVDLRDGAGDRRARARARHDRRTVGQVREVVLVGRAAAFVGHVGDGAVVGEHDLARGVADRDLVEHRAGGGVDHAELVGAVERHVELRPVRRERHPGRQFGAVGDVGSLGAVLAELAGVVVAAAIGVGRGVGAGRCLAGAAPAQEGRRAFLGGCPGVVVEAELQQELRLWNPQGRDAACGVWGEQRPVGGDGRVIAVVCVERGLLHHRPGLQVEDRQEALEVVPAQGRQIPAVWADRARHEPGALLGGTTVDDSGPQRRDPLVRGEEDAVGIRLRNLLVCRTG